MKRFWPHSIAGRTTLVLIAGVLAVLWAGSMVWWLSNARGEGSPANRIAFESIASVAAIIDRTPPQLRADALKAATSENLILTWSTDQSPSQASDLGWEPRWIVRHLRRSLAARGLSNVRIGIGHGHHFNGAGKSISAYVQLSDSSWLTVSAPDRLHGPPRLIAFIGMIAIVAIGLAGLAILVSRRVTGPLRRFSAAAARFGADVDAPPMTESGPTEIREAAQAFNQMQHRIQRFVEDRTRMLAAVSHDLRTMLTRLRLRAEYIEDDEQRGKAFADLTEMQNMLNQTLSFARDDANAEASTSVDLSSLLQTLCDDLADAGQPVIFEGPPRLTLTCRPMALGRAFANLIDNAVTYGSEALVQLSDGAGEVIIRIADRGPGIAESDREKIFAPFYRMEESRSRDTGGAGLGLALARNFVRAHGGDITLEDRDGGGLVVRVSLPRGARQS
jgi:signal transduction histidine kinase